MTDDAPTVLPAYVGGEPVQPNADLVVHDKFSGEGFAAVPMLGPRQVEAAIRAAVEVAPVFAASPAWRRRDALRACAERIAAVREELAATVVAESGKPLRDARTEVSRLLETFAVAAEEATRMAGEVIPLDLSERSERYRGMTRRVPVGPCGFITPFNFPLNLVAHKVAPAIACGCPFVLKPALTTPVSAIRLVEALIESLRGSGLPAAVCAVVPCSNEDAGPIVEDPRLRLLSFTGSDVVGKRLAARAGMKRVLLELGGNAACVVDESAGDDGGLEDCVERLVLGAFAQSGQSCISVQRVLVHASLYEDLAARFAARISTLRVGDPRDPETVVGPLISEQAAETLERRIRDAVSAGAEVLVGGQRRGAVHPPTLLKDVPADADLSREEAFGPVAILSSFDRFEDALERVNDSRFGLQAGVFTNDLRRMHAAWDRLRVGGVVINDVPSFRVDAMPYGGVKDSGLGREGVRSAILAMTEERLLVVRDR